MQFGNAIAGILSNHRQLTEARIRQARELAVRNRELDIQQRLAQARISLLGKQGELADANATLAATRNSNADTEGKILGKQLTNYDENFQNEQELLDQQTDAQKALAELRRAQRDAVGQDEGGSGGGGGGVDSNPDARAVYTTVAEELQTQYSRVSEIETLIEGIMASPELDEYGTARLESLKKEKETLLQHINRNELLKDQSLKRIGFDTGASAGTQTSPPPQATTPPASGQRISTGVNWNTNN